MTRKNNQLIVGAVAATFIGLFAGAASAAEQTPSPQAALALAHQFGGVAARAEKAAPASQINAQVVAALENTIVATGAEPRLVFMALQNVTLECRARAGLRSADWSCPVTPAAYDAFQSLQNIVLAQLDQTGVAAIGTFGPAAFGSIPTTSAGGSGYVTP